MTSSPRARHAIAAFTNWLNQRKGEIDANLRTVHPESRALTILPYWTGNVDADLYPLLMIELTRKARSWEALDTGAGPVANIRLSLTLWGLVHGEKDEILEKLADELEGSVADVLNARHQAFESDGWKFYFKETMPVPEASFGVASFKGAVTRGFTASVLVDAIYTRPQHPGT